MINAAPEVLLNIADRKTWRTLSHDLLTSTLLIPHSYCGKPSLSVPWAWCFHNVSAHTTFILVCETVEREVTDSIIPGRWVYIHLPPQDGSVPGKKAHGLGCHHSLFQTRLYPTWIFLCMRTRYDPRALDGTHRIGTSYLLVRKSSKGIGRHAFDSIKGDDQKVDK